jgi:citrate lyase subunit alpha/citrate CoA-transferase
VNQLDVVVLSALECDTDFNVNVLTGSDGVIRGAIGGHQDTAAGAKVSIIVCPLTRGRIPCVVDKVGCLITPGATVDVIVTEYGVAVNPRRADLKADLEAAGIPIADIHALKDKAQAIVGPSDCIQYTDQVVGTVTYRDGSVLDQIRAVK